MEFSQFWGSLVSQPWSFVALILTLGVTFVNGWTDAPNAIATAVGTRAMTPKTGVILAVIFNLLGVTVVGFLTQYLPVGDVAHTIASLFKFNLSTPQAITDALIAVCFALFSIVAWSLGSTIFGFPSSESNELVGGIIGGAMAVNLIGGQNVFAGIGWTEFGMVIYGFVLSLIIGFVLGYLLVKGIEFVCRNIARAKTTNFFIKGEVAASCLTALVHGIQDGAKFIGVIILIAAICNGSQDTAMMESLSGVWWIVLPVAFMMTLGTSFGGYSIIKTMGTGMAKLEKHQGFATDIASTIGLLMATAFGWPVSTGSVKTTSIIGAGAARGLRTVKWKTSGSLIASWFAIFPACALIALLPTLLFAFLF